MVARLIKWADRSGSRSELAAFFSMVDRRKALHRRASEWAAACPEVFLAGHVPYASIVEQMTVRRMPLHAFAAADPAAAAFAGIRAELQARLERRGRGSARQREKWPRLLQAVESLVVRLERGDPDAVAPPMRGSSADDVTFVHSFDTGQRDLQRCGYVLELRERPGSFLVVAARSDSAADNAQVTGRAQAQIDRRWAIQILSGAMSPLTALERRLGPPVPRVIEIVRALVGRSLLRVDSRATGRPGAAHEPADDGDREHGRSRKLPNPTTV
jgi:hypothetical protein